MIPRRPHPTGSVAKKPSLRVVSHEAETKAPRPLPAHAQEGARMLACSIVYSAVCDIIAHDHGEVNDPIDAELKRIAVEMWERSRA